MSPLARKPFKVSIDRSLESLIPKFLDSRRQDLLTLKAELANTEKVAWIAHNIKGLSGGYGFDELSELGAKLEVAAHSAELVAAQGLIDQIESYLDSVVIEWIDEEA